MQLAYMMGQSSESNISIISPLGQDNPLWGVLEQLPPLDCDLGNSSDYAINSGEPASDTYPTASPLQVAARLSSQRAGESFCGKQVARPHAVGKDCSSQPAEAELGDPKATMLDVLEEGGNICAPDRTPLEACRSMVSMGVVNRGSCGVSSPQRLTLGFGMDSSLAEGLLRAQSLEARLQAVLVTEAHLPDPFRASPEPLLNPGSGGDGSGTSSPLLVYPCPIPPPVSVFATTNASPFEASVPHPQDTAQQQTTNAAKVQQLIIRSLSVGGGGRSGGHRIPRQRSAKGAYCNAMFIRDKGTPSLECRMSGKKSTFLDSEDSYHASLDFIVGNQPLNFASTQQPPSHPHFPSLEVAHPSDALGGLSPAVSIEQDIKGQETMQRLLGYNSRSGSGVLPVNVKAHLPGFTGAPMNPNTGAQREVTATAFNGDASVKALSAALQALDSANTPGSTQDLLPRRCYSPPPKRTPTSSHRPLQTAASAPLGRGLDAMILGITPLERFMGVCKPAQLSARATEAFPVLTRRYSCSMASGAGQSVTGVPTERPLTAGLPRKSRSPLDGWLSQHAGHSSVYGRWWFPDSHDGSSGLYPVWESSIAPRKGLDTPQVSPPPPLTAAAKLAPPFQRGGPAGLSAASGGRGLPPVGDSIGRSEGSDGENVKGEEKKWPSIGPPCFHMASEMPRGIPRSLTCDGIPE